MDDTVALQKTLLAEIALTTKDPKAQNFSANPSLDDDKDSAAEAAEAATGAFVVMDDAFCSAITVEQSHQQLDGLVYQLVVHAVGDELDAQLSDATAVQVTDDGDGLRIVGAKLLEVVDRHPQ